MTIVNLWLKPFPHNVNVTFYFLSWVIIYNTLQHTAQVKGFLMYESSNVSSCLNMLLDSVQPMPLFTVWLHMEWVCFDNVNYCIPRLVSSINWREGQDAIKGCILSIFLCNTNSDGFCKKNKHCSPADSNNELSCVFLIHPFDYSFFHTLYRQRAFPLYDSSCVSLIHPFDYSFFHTLYRRRASPPYASPCVVLDGRY